MKKGPTRYPKKELKVVGGDGGKCGREGEGGERGRKREKEGEKRRCMVGSILVDVKKDYQLKKKKKGGELTWETTEKKQKI